MTTQKYHLLSLSLSLFCILLYPACVRFDTSYPGQFFRYHLVFMDLEFFVNRLSSRKPIFRITIKTFEALLALKYGVFWMQVVSKII